MLHILKSSDVSNNVINTIEVFDGIYKLHSFSFTNNLYNITSNNNILPYQQGASYYAIELTQQFANGTDIASDIQTKLNAIPSANVSVSYDSNTSKFTITNTTSFYLKFGDVTLNTCSELLGFSNTNTTDGLSVTSTTTADLIPFKQIYINIEQDTFKNIKNENYTENTFLISGSCNFSDNFTYISKENDINPQICNFKATKRLKISFYNEKDENISPQNWLLTLIQNKRIDIL